MTSVRARLELSTRRLRAQRRAFSIIGRSIGKRTGGFTGDLGQRLDDGRGCCARRSPEASTVPNGCAASERFIAHAGDDPRSTIRADAPLSQSRLAANSPRWRNCGVSSTRRSRADRRALPDETTPHADAGAGDHRRATWHEISSAPLPRRGEQPARAAGQQVRRHQPQRRQNGVRYTADDTLTVP